MKNIYLTLFILFSISCSQQSELQVMENEPEGKNMVLIGNSFFRPYAQKFDLMALDLQIQNHQSTLIFRGGDNGRPINFWNDSNASEHQAIKDALDTGEINLFGMTAGHEPENPTEGHRAWIDYAVQRNPNITIFIAIPPIDFPADWDQLVEEYGFETMQELYDYFVNLVHQRIIDPLRLEFPSTKIFTIPTGWATVNLAQMKLDDLLEDEISMFGSSSNSIFTDQKGHQGEIVQETGALVWLESIYQIDLSTHNYDTGFQTNLHQIAEEIANSHYPNYKQ